VVLAGAFVAAVGLNSTLVGAAPEEPAITNASSANTRRGLFNWLDSRSDYGQDAFPEPFLVDDSALETNESRFDWLHTSGNGQRSDEATVEVEKGVGLLTLEVEFHFERNVFSGAGGDTIERGMGNIDFGARYPVFQYVSKDGGVDLTLGAAAELGVPTHSVVSQNTEVVPKIFADLKLGDHFTLQSIFGYSMLYGGGDEGGLHAVEYGFVFGYTIQHQELELPHVLQIIPILELAGETEVNKADAGHHSLLGNVGFRLNLKAIGQVQPRIGVGYVFPIDQGARADLRRGLVTSLVFEY
jgi:hypothetical protein